MQGQKIQNRYHNNYSAKISSSKQSVMHDKHCPQLKSFENVCLSKGHGLLVCWCHWWHAAVSKERYNKGVFNKTPASDAFVCASQHSVCYSRILSVPQSNIHPNTKNSWSIVSINFCKEALPLTTNIWPASFTGRLEQCNSLFSIAYFRRNITHNLWYYGNNNLAFQLLNFLKSYSLDFSLENIVYCITTTSVKDKHCVSSTYLLYYVWS